MLIHTQKNSLKILKYMLSLLSGDVLNFSKIIQLFDIIEVCWFKHTARAIKNE